MIPASLSLLLTAPATALLAAGLAWPLVARRELEPVEKVVATAALSLTGVYLFGWLAFVARLPTGAHALLPFLAAAGLAARRRELAALWRDADARALLLAQLAVTAWCVGWLATIFSYSGGGWAGDWIEHWERTRHILERGPRDALFIGHAPVTARPPLANAVTAVILSLGGADFARYQLVSTLLGSLAFAPAAVWARHWGGARAVPAAAVLFMLNPLFVQNATFAWTKLPTAFFVLAAAWFWRRAAGEPRPLVTALLGAGCLAAALLTHYSAGPYALVLAGLWAGWSWRRRGESLWWRATALAAASGGLLLATWFAWALVVYGAGGTLLANTSVQTAAASPGEQFVRILLNVRDTLIPHFLRTLDPALIAQSSPWGAWRDWFFQAYQVNLPLALGSTGWLVLVVRLYRAGTQAPAAARAAWGTALLAVILVGIAVHGARDTWGLTHICLQPLVLLGLALLAAQLPDLGRGWRLALVAGVALDAAAGILLHFGVQSLVLDHWLSPDRRLDAIFAAYNGVAWMNLAAKVQQQLAFFSDLVAPPLALVGLWLGGWLAWACWRCRRPVPHDH